ncbi:autophagy- protein 2 [Chytriomyces hyalinus]|nr:autophagy- protein 2 [Chytriomyces hyalinus]
MESVSVYFVKHLLGQYLTYESERTEGGSSSSSNSSSNVVLVLGGVHLKSEIVTLVENAVSPPNNGLSDARSHDEHSHNEQHSKSTSNNQLRLRILSVSIAEVRVSLPVPRVSVLPSSTSNNGRTELSAVVSGLRVALAYEKSTPAASLNMNVPQQNNARSPVSPSDSVHFARDYLRQEDSIHEFMINKEYTTNAAPTTAVSSLAELMDTIFNSISFEIKDVAVSVRFPPSLVSPISAPVFEVTLASLIYNIKNSASTGGPTSKSTKSYGLSGVLDKLATKALTFSGLGLVYREYTISNSNPAELESSQTPEPLGSIVFESSLFFFKDVSINNPIHIRVKQDLATQPSPPSPSASEYTTAASANLDSLVPVWDISASIDSIAYTVMNLDSLARIARVLKLFKEQNSHDNDASAVSPDSGDARVDGAIPTFRVQLTMAFYSAFLVYSRSLISEDVKRALLSGDESLMSNLAINHMKLELSDFRFVFARDVNARFKCHIEAGRLDVSEFFQVASTQAPAKPTITSQDSSVAATLYTPILHMNGTRYSRLSERARVLYRCLETALGNAASTSQLDANVLVDGVPQTGAAFCIPESMVFRYAPRRRTVSPGGGVIEVGTGVGVSVPAFGDMRGEEGVICVHASWDLEERRVDVVLGDVCVFADVQTFDRVKQVFLGMLDGMGGDDREDRESHYADSETSYSEHADSPTQTQAGAVPVHVNLTVELLRVWARIPTGAIESSAAENPCQLVLDILDTKITVNDPHLSKRTKHGHHDVDTNIHVFVGGIGLSLAVPISLWKEYSLSPILFIGNTISDDRSVSTVSVQTMKPSVISMDGTVYYDGNEGYEDDEEEEEEDIGNESDSDNLDQTNDASFGAKSWFNVDDDLGAGRKERLPKARPKLSALGRGKVKAMTDSKATLLVNLNRIRLSVGKTELDMLQLLANQVQVWMQNNFAQTSQTQAPSAEEMAGYDGEYRASNEAAMFSVVLNIQEIAVCLYSVVAETRAVQWAYSYQMLQNSIVAVAGLDGEMKVYLETDSFSLTDADGQSILLRSEQSKQRRPMLNLRLKSCFDPLIQMKENTLNIGISELRILLVGELVAVMGRNFQDFFTEPPGMQAVEAVDAVTKISVTFNNLLVDYRPMYRNFRAAVVLAKMKVLMNLIPHSPIFGVSVSIQDLMVSVLKSSAYIGFDIDEQSLMMDKGLRNYLKLCRYANVLSCDVLDISLRHTKHEGLDATTEVEITNSHAYVDCCLDSFRLLTDIAEYLGAGGDAQYAGEPLNEEVVAASEKSEARRRASVQEEQNIMGSIDESAFAKFVPKPQIPEAQQYVESDTGIQMMGDEATVEITIPTEPLRREEIIIEDDTPFYYRHDHLSLTGTPDNDFDNLEPNKFAYLLMHVNIQDFSLSLRLFDGFDFAIGDFPDDDSDINSISAVEEPANGDDYNDSTEPSPTSKTSASRTIEPRSSQCRIQVNVSKVNLAANLFPTASQWASELQLSVALVEVIDNVKTSMWRKFLTTMRLSAEDRPISTESSMIVLELLKVRPDLATPEVQEIRLKVHVAPLRFYVDQDALTFIGHFLSYGTPPPGSETVVPKDSSPRFNDDPFFQICTIHAIPVKIDYKPKHVNLGSLRDGNLLEVFNFMPLEGAEMTLNHVRLNGVRGVEKLISLIRNQWLPDVTKNQYHRVVKGLSGVKPVANIGAGIADLILLPWRQYQKEGRVLRGLEKGVKSFSRAAAIETLSLGTRIAVTTQAILEGAEETTTARKKSSFGDAQNRSKLSEQPRDIREGMELAYQSLSRNVGDAVKTVIDAPARRVQHADGGGGGGAGFGGGGGGSSGGGRSAAAVAQAVPVAILRPMIGATEAVSKALLGIQNTIDPTRKMESDDKYKD